MMKKWRCVLLNEDSFVRDEKRELGREVREFEKISKKKCEKRIEHEKCDGVSEGL